MDDGWIMEIMLYALLTDVFTGQCSINGLGPVGTSSAATSLTSARALARGLVSLISGIRSRCCPGGGGVLSVN